MSTQELENKVRELRQLQALIEEAETEAENIKNEIKAIMGTQEELKAGEYKVTWKQVKSVRIDLNGLKMALPDVAKAFSREITTRRFCVA